MAINPHRKGGPDVPIVDGGTEASDSATARANLGVSAGGGPRYIEGLLPAYKSASEITVDPNGEGQVSVRITGPRSTVIVAAFPGTLPIDALEHTTNGGGEVFVRFDQGKGLRSSEPIKVKFCPRNGSDLVPAYLTVNLR